MSEVKATTVDGSTEANVNISMADGQAAVKPVEGDTADTMGVTQAQFDKFYKDGNYDWQSHAKEVEFAVSQKGKADPNATEGGTGDEVASTDAPEGAEDTVSKAGLNWDELGVQIAHNGDIDQDAKDALTKIGVPEDVVNEYIGNLTFRAEAHVATVTAALGGDDGIKAIKEWAPTAFTPEQINAIEQQLADPAQYQLAVDLLLAKSGRPPVENGAALAGPNAASPGTTAVSPYATQSEMVADQSNPKYKTDPAFRANVYKRAAASNFDTNPRAHVSGL